MTPISGEEWTTNTEAPQQGLDPPDGTSRNAESTDPLKKPSPAWVFGPDVEFPEAGKKEPSFAKGYLATLLVILSLIELHVWLAANGYGGLETMLAKFIFE